MADKNIIYNEDTVTYDSYSGTEQTLWIKIKDENNKEYSIQLGKVESITINTQTAGKPIFALGKKKAIAYAEGMTVTGGAISFGVLECSAIQDINNKLVALEAKLPLFKNMDELPPFFVEIIAKKENNNSVTSTRTIKNIIIMDAQSAIGLDNITVGETYTFTAQEMTPFINTSNGLETKKTFGFQTRN